MISEIDIRDWEHINIPRAKKALESVKEALLSDVYADDYNYLNKFLNDMELIRKRHIKQVASLLKKG